MTGRVSRLSLSYYKLKRKSTQLDQLNQSADSSESSSKEDTSFEDKNEVYSEPLNLENESKLVQLMVQFFPRDNKKNESANGENGSHSGKQQDSWETKSLEDFEKKSTVDLRKPGKLRGESSSSGSPLTEFKKEKLGFLSVKDQSGRFPCVWCKKAYSTEFNLRRHCLKHKEEKNKQMFHCRNCWRKFDRRDMLDKHLLSHKNERPHVCGVCRRRFKHKCHLNAHIKFDRCFKNDKAKYY